VTVIISGTVNETPFACPAGNTTCSVPVTSEGNVTANFRVDSSSGGSAGSSVSYKLDATTPQISGVINGASGTNGWFVSAIDFSASASDTISGLASLEILVDGGEWQSYAAPITLGDGFHTVSLRAYDYAGNMAETNQTVNVDTLTPLLDVSVSGSMGLNGWYISEAETSAFASDNGSGLFSLEVGLDDESWKIYDAPIILSDGIHTVSFRATDNAGNVTTLSQEIKVDTITPSLSLSVNGTKGLNGWYKSITNAATTASDSGSGIAGIEGSSDGGTWTPVSSLSFSDGLHTWQFRARDNAGNLTESPVQNIRIDTIPPFIGMTEELSLGETLYYELTDEGSGLSAYRSVIEDDAEKYKKVSWVDTLSGNMVQGDILWDGKFKDGTEAGMGEYFITLKISDAAGNEALKSAVVKVDLLSFFQNIPAFTPPTDIVTGNEEWDEETATGLTFGNTNSGTISEKTSSSTSTGGENVFHETTTQASFTQGGQTADSPITNSNILWGAAAASLVGATTAGWQRKRQREAAARRAAREERLANGPSTYRQATMNFQKSLDNFKTTLLNGGFSHKEAGELKSHAILSGLIPSAKELVEKKEKKESKQAAQLTREEKAEAARILAETEAAKKDAEELQAGMMAYYQGRKGGEVTATPKESWWEKTLNWIDKHQVEISIGVGIIVGVAAIVLSGGAATPLVAAAWIAGAAAVAGGTVALGTVGLNAYYGRALGENVARNLAVAGGTAAIVTGAGFALPGLMQSIGSYCALNSNACARIEPVMNAIDTAEQGWLIVQGAYQSWTGDIVGAAETAFELQMEYADGGMPGNSFSREAVEQLAKLGDNVPELIAAYGDDIVPLLLRHGDDAVDIIGAYGDDGISLLILYGDDAIRLIKDHGTPAVKLLGIVGSESADKLFRALDDDVLDYAIKQDADAILALSGWSEKELKEFGPELALRAKKDAEALKAINSLVRTRPIDPKNLTDQQKVLIQTIAENSMQYNDEGQVVLGKWVDYANGFTSYARETGSVHYNPHPDMWNLLDPLGNKRDSTAWLVNEKVIQVGVKKGLPFEYTLNGLPSDKLEIEEYAIEKIWEGGPSKEAIYDNLKDSLGTDDIPVRLKELVELYSAGYVYSFDSATSSYILIKP
jgi:hypothetical protein